ncbi:sugar phosphate isomerase/epimerase family protein [Ornithinimicrobium sediminis]|uniref:sugar phosphate isomerase/epimerase family protein n=1 Tax=Ornithinimicrobium sediminis TaxID=2904603 RepID=UPI001E2E8A91|nr:sugar phosphate isomerase/epimerase family protein [Ornithinimicrobium sediminis]MCE0487396.1 sugar phosphate isomerase/epimerase [Ornithinimicrobium sediminis]
MLIGCHGLVWTGQYNEAGIRRAVEQTRVAGFDLIEFPLMDPTTFDAGTARAALDEHGLVASGSLGLSEATDISSEDPAAVRAGEELLDQAVDVLAELGSRHLCGIVYSAMSKYQQPATERGVANSRAVVERVASRAAQAGIQVSVEVTNRYESNVLNTARQAREYVTGMDPAVGVHLDTYHMNIEETGMFAPVLETAHQLRYVHIGESHRGYLGTGSVDFDSFFKALRHIDYDGPVVFESFSSAVVSPTLTGALGIWRNLWENGAELGAHANVFIRGHLTAMSSLRHH